MATFLCWSGGDNSSGTEASGWAAAKTTFEATRALCTADGDVIKVAHVHQESVGADTTYTFTVDTQVICVNKDSSDAPTAMDGTTGYINNAGSWSIFFAGAREVYVYGLAVIISGSGAKSLRIAQTDGASHIFENCKLHLTNSSASTVYRLGIDGAGNCYTKLVDCQFRFGSVSQYMTCCHRVEMEGCTIDTGGTAPSSVGLINFATATDAIVTAVGCDFSHVGAGTLILGAIGGPTTVYLIQCKLNSGPTFATQTVTNKSSVDAFVFDCSSGDTHGLFAHYNALGSTVIDPNIYYTGSPAGQMSWKIVGTSAATRYNPYISPWISVYVSALSAITPRVEILRDGNTTPYLDSEVHLELSAKNTSGSTRATIFTTRPTLLATGSNIATGAGTGSWTVAPGAWSGKLVISSFAPDEVGPMAARVVVGGALTVYADPVIRT